MDIATVIRPRDPLSHKGQHGHALLVAGSKGKMGAAVLAAAACLRTGAGLVTVNIPESERMILQTAIPEAMLQWRDDKQDMTKYGAVGIGPAAGTGEPDLQLLQQVLQQRKPVVIDADALTLLAAHKALQQLVPPGSVLTPHPKEFDRVFGEHADKEARKEKAIMVSQQYPWVIVLKGAGTMVIAGGGCYTNTTGNAGLAKGGSGDVLCGMITALLAQGYTPFHAAAAGVHLHGLAADIAVKQQSPESLLATDVINCIGKAFDSLHNR